MIKIYEKVDHLRKLYSFSRSLQPPERIENPNTFIIGDQLFGENQPDGNRIKSETIWPSLQIV